MGGRGGGYNFRRGLILGVNFENPQNVKGVEISRHGTVIPCKCCQTILWLKQIHVSFNIRIGGSLPATKFYLYRIIAPTVLDCKCKTHGATPPCILLVAAPEFRQRWRWWCSLLSCRSRSQVNVKLGHFTLWLCRNGKEISKKHDALAEL